MFSYFRALLHSFSLFCCSAFCSFSLSLAQLSLYLSCSFLKLLQLHKITTFLPSTAEKRRHEKPEKRRGGLDRCGVVDGLSLRLLLVGDSSLLVLVVLSLSSKTEISDEVPVGSHAESTEEDD